MRALRREIDADSISELGGGYLYAVLFAVIKLHPAVEKGNRKTAAVLVELGERILSLLRLAAFSSVFR